MCNREDSSNAVLNRDCYEQDGGSGIPSWGWIWNRSVRDLFYNCRCHDGS